MRRDVLGHDSNITDDDRLIFHMSSMFLCMISTGTNPSQDHSKLFKGAYGLKIVL